MMKPRLLFLDRDGTLICEPEKDQQVDSLEKLELRPGVVVNLYRVAVSGLFELVMVTNQDGLGTPTFSAESFRAPQDKLMGLLANEGIGFSAVHIDSTWSEENAPTRKPGTGMLNAYLDGDYDLEHSYVVGDRLSDVELARNLGCRAVWYSEDTIGNRDRLVAAGLQRWCDLVSSDWAAVADFLLGMRNRAARVSRKTRETDIACAVDLDGKGCADISTGLPFLDHMLQQVAVHARMDIRLRALGDLQTGPHHTVEDCAIVLGTALRKAMSRTRNRTRYGFLLPMDDSLARVALDLGGRSWLSWQVRFKRESVGGIPTEMFSHFFRSFVTAAGITLHVRATGTNDHHRIEAVFKALGRALGRALRRDGTPGDVPSSKGVLQ